MLNNNLKEVERTHSVITLQRMFKMMDANKLRVDNKYQRAFGAWDSKMVSDIIHSVLMDYNIGSAFLAKWTESDHAEFIDFQQRAYNMRKFVNGDFKVNTIKSGHIIEEFATLFKEERPYIHHKYTSGKRITLSFKDLPETLQDKFNDYTVQVTYITDPTDEYLVTQFIKTQQGKPLTYSEIVHAIRSTFKDRVKEITTDEKFVNLLSGCLTKKDDLEKDVTFAMLDILKVVNGHGTLNTPSKTVTWLTNKHQNKSTRKIDNAIRVFNDFKNNLPNDYEFSGGKTEMKLLLILIYFTFDKCHTKKGFNIYTYLDMVTKIATASGYIYTNMTNGNEISHTTMEDKLVELGLFDYYYDNQEGFTEFSKLRAKSHGIEVVEKAVKRLTPIINDLI